MTHEANHLKQRGRRGLVIVLVMVSLVLLVILGTGYMQLTRSDRLANAASARQGISQVEEAVTSYIGQVLRDDLFLNDSSFPYTPGDPDAGVEAFDYPFTNPKAGERGNRDDTWLASGYFDFTTPSAPLLPHMSNLMGLWVDLPRVGAPVGTLPIERTTTADNNANTGDTNLPVFGANGLFPGSAGADYEPRGADATGDGYPDSRFTWAPIRQIGDVVYVMAVHIVDLSSYVNMNTATAQSNDVPSGGGVVVQGGTDYPRFWYPSELDAHRTLTQFSDYNGTYVSGTSTSELSDTLANLRRFPTNALPTTWAVRDLFWFDGVRTGFDPLVIYRRIDSPQTEAELRHRSGLNNDRMRPLLEEQMLFTLQDASAGDVAFLDVNASAADLATYAANLQTLYANNARNALTVFSGTNYLAPAIAGTTEVRELFDLNALMDPADANYAQTKTDFADLLLTPSDASGVFGTGAAIPFAGDANTAAAQYMACLIDYFDSDTSPADLAPDETSAVTKVTVNGATGYGMEAAPFLTEVYIQGRYWLTRAMEQPPASGNYTFGWSRMGDIGYVIEVVNPWSSPVRNLEDIRIGVVDSSGTFTPWGTLYDLTGGSARTLDPQAGIILYHDSASNAGAAVTASANDDVKSVIGWGLPAGWLEADMNGVAALAGNDEVVIELQIRVDPNNGGGGDEWVTYSRIQAKHNDGTPAIALGSPAHLQMPQNISNATDPLSPYQPSVAYEIGTDKYERYVQKTAIMNAQGLNPVVVKVLDGAENEIYSVGTLDPSAGEGGTIPRLPPDDAGAADDRVGPIPGARVAPGGGAGSIGIARITSDLKPGTTPIDSTELDGDTSFASRAYGFDDVAIRFPTDLTRVMWVGPNATQTYAQVFRGALGAVTNDTASTPVPDALRSRMLTWFIGDVVEPWVVGEAHDVSIPRAALLMDRVTTIPMDRAAMDYIPGRLNINTAPLALIANALPINDAALRNTIATQIGDMRRGAATTVDIGGNAIALNRTRGSRPGIASLGELMQLPDVREALTSAATPVYDTFFAGDTTNQIPIAFDGGGNSLAGGSTNPPVDDRTEEVRLAGFLSNLFTVRSDRFAAYIYIRGYKVDQFHLGPVEASRFMVIYDRSNITDPTDATQRVRTYGPFRVD